MFNTEPNLKSTMKFMTLSNGKISIHLELNEDVFWKLTEVAARDQQSTEEWLEHYLSDEETLSVLLFNTNV